VIDIGRVRNDFDELARQLARRGFPLSSLEELRDADVAHRAALVDAETLRAEIKELSRQVGEARRAKNDVVAEELMAKSRELGDREAAARAVADERGESVVRLNLMVPNTPSDDTPDGADENDNVETFRWWPGSDGGAAEPIYGDHQRVAHWDIGSELGLLDIETAVKLAGSMFVAFRGDGARLQRALTSFALDQHRDAYVEIAPPSVALTDTMMSTGHLPKSHDDMYAIERDNLWLIPTGEVPLTSMRRGDILSTDELPIRLTTVTQCFRREAGSAGRDTRGLLRVHEFQKVELFAYCTPEQATAAHADILARAENLLRHLGLTYRRLDLCAGDIGTSAKRTVDLEVYAPGVDKWLEVSSVSWFGDYQARRANVRYRQDDGSTAFVHTVNGSALAWPRIWAALVEVNRQEDGSIRIPEVLRPYLGGQSDIR
jgi:seryl-tRNA synthetase